MHKILEDSVKTKNFTFDPMHPLITCLNKATRDHITNKMPALFAMPEFVSLMHYPEVFTEMPIGYRQDNIVYFSRIDLVAISEQELVIIDYKSEKNPPQLLKDVNPKYIMQIESYAKAMRKIKPYHKISAKILWLENLHMMEILKC
ncbi:MAG UNVERIFIED_CONTAM: PD-(D/E)XK nuclease family protein [Rickettsiaceae bacterium]